MTRKTGVHVFKYTVYVLLILFLYIFQETPSLFSIFGVKPLLLVPAVICIAMFEGEFAGALLGAFAGCLCDIGGITIFGFNGIMMLIMCTICGLLIMFWLSRNAVSAFLLCTAVLFIRGTVEYFVCLAIWGFEGIGMYYVQHTLPCIVYSAIISPVFFFAVKKIHEIFEEKLKD